MTKSVPRDDSRPMQPRGVFYGLLEGKEIARTREIIDGLKEFMGRQQRSRGRYLVAGVGGILRHPQPFEAKDIDLAVVGLKYTASPGRTRDHNWTDVQEFTETIFEYFEGLHSKLVMEYGLTSEQTLLRGGSSPLKGVNTIYQLNAAGGEKRVMLKSDLESFGPWDAKGLQVQFHDARRPIDVQFVFNKTIAEWVGDQERKRLPYDMLEMK